VRDRATARPAPSPSLTREPRRRPSLRTILLASAVVVWILGFVFLHGTSTLTLPASELTELHRSLNQFNVWVAANRADNPVFLYA
jgi:glycine betaine/proline transport system permease protein